MGGVFRCSVNNCGRFYHRHCVELNANSVIKADLDEVRLMLTRGFVSAKEVRDWRFPVKRVNLSRYLPCTLCVCVYFQ